MQDKIITISVLNWACRCEVCCWSYSNHFLDCTVRLNITLSLHAALQYTYNIPTMYLQCTYNVSTIQLQCTYNIPTMHLQCT